MRGQQRTPVDASDILQSLPLFIFLKNNSTLRFGVTIMLVCRVVPFTHSRSCVCQLPARIQGRRHICNCPACSDSAARSDRCQVWRTHPSLANDKNRQNQFSGAR